MAAAISAPIPDASTMPGAHARTVTPTSYLKKVYVDTVVFTPVQLTALVDAFGVDHVIMGTDYPFDMLENDPIGHVASVDRFDEKTRAALVGGNAKKMLGM